MFIVVAVAVEMSGNKEMVLACEIGCLPHQKLEDHLITGNACDTSGQRDRVYI